MGGAVRFVDYSDLPRLCSGYAAKNRHNLLVFDPANIAGHLPSGGNKKERKKRVAVGRAIANDWTTLLCAEAAYDELQPGSKKKFEGAGAEIYVVRKVPSAKPPDANGEISEGDWATISLAFRLGESVSGKGMQNPGIYLASEDTDIVSWRNPLLRKIKDAGIKVLPDYSDLAQLVRKDY
ncbi:MAG: hypothetical protein V1820_03710 [archaeon]